MLLEFSFTSFPLYLPLFPLYLSLSPSFSLCLFLYLFPFFLFLLSSLLVFLLRPPPPPSSSPSLFHLFFLYVTHSNLHHPPSFSSFFFLFTIILKLADVPNRHCLVLFNFYSQPPLSPSFSHSLSFYLTLSPSLYFTLPLSSISLCHSLHDISSTLLLPKLLPLLFLHPRHPLLHSSSALLTPCFRDGCILLSLTT